MSAVTAALVLTRCQLLRDVVSSPSLSPLLLNRNVVTTRRSFMTMTKPSVLSPKASKFGSTHYNHYYFNSNRQFIISKTNNNALDIQRRNYLFVPVSWLELQERMRHWLFSAERRTVKVYLLDRYHRGKQSYNQNKAFLRASATKTYNKAKERYAAVKRHAMRRQERLRKKWTIMGTETVKNIPTTLSITTTNKWRDNIGQWNRNLTDRYQRWNLKRLQRQEQRLKQLNIDNNSNERSLSQFERWRLSQTSDTFMQKQQVTITEYSQAEWFDEMGRPVTSRDKTGRFVNPWQSQSTNGVTSLRSILTWQWIRFKKLVLSPAPSSLNITKKDWTSMLPKLTFDGDVIPLTKQPNLLAERPSPIPSFVSEKPSRFLDDFKNNKSSIQMTWVGHSTCLLKMNKFRILTDPIFSLRSSPFQSLPIGMARDVPPSHGVDELGGTIDICCISHDHYDHLDKFSVKKLRKQVKLWVVPLGISEWLQEKCGISSDRIVELEWWQQLEILKSDHHDGEQPVIAKVTATASNPTNISNDSILHTNTYNNKKPTLDNASSLTITCCPAQHWAGRTLWDRNSRLWCSFAFKEHETNGRVYFGGDTAYPESFPLFSQIGDAVGPFDLALLPIGAYEPQIMMKESHTTPSEAIQIHQEIRSKHSIGIHWGTFRLSEEDPEEPPQWLQEAMSKKQQKYDSITTFRTIPHGTTIRVPIESRQQMVMDIGHDDDLFDREDNDDYNVYASAGI